MNKLSTMWSRAKRPVTAMALVAVAAVGFAPAAMAFGNTSKVLVSDNTDPTVSGGAGPYTSVTGTWHFATYDNLSNASSLNGAPYGTNTRYSGTQTGSASGEFSWYTGPLTVGPGGPYTIEAFIPDNVALTPLATYRIERGSTSDCAASTWTLLSNVTIDQGANHGSWARLGAYNFDQNVCYRVTLSNLAANAGWTVWADAIRFQRAYEHKLTIPDMPNVFSANNAGAITITGTSGGTATDIRTLTVTCPADGKVLINGSGESVAKSNAVGYMGIAYSIAKDTAVADINTVIQSSAQSVYNGDENRDFLSIQRFDSCTKGQTITYHLVGYLAQPQTTTASYIWNARLSAIFTP